MRFEIHVADRHWRLADDGESIEEVADGEIALSVARGRYCTLCRTAGGDVLAFVEAVDPGAWGRLRTTLNAVALTDIQQFPGGLPRLTALSKGSIPVEVLAGVAAVAVSSSGVFSVRQDSFSVVLDGRAVIVQFEYLFDRDVWDVDATAV